MSRRSPTTTATSPHGSSPRAISTTIPQPLEIQGVRPANRFLFQQARRHPTAEERASLFNDYMSVKFQLHHWQDQATDKARKSLKNSYLRFLRGWMMDSNSIEGAVLKGWVESRMGLPPTFTRCGFPDIHAEEYMIYAIDRTKGSARTNAINSQLDLLYEYCQYELARKYPGPADHHPLPGYLSMPDEHDLLERIGKREQIVRLNNLSPSPPTRSGPGSSASRSGRCRSPSARSSFSTTCCPTAS